MIPPLCFPCAHWPLTSRNAWTPSSTPSSQSTPPTPASPPRVQTRQYAPLHRRPASRHPNRDPGPSGDRGRGGHGWHRRLAGPDRAAHRNADAQADGCGNDQPRQDPHRRVRLWRRGHQPASRHALEPMGREHAPPAGAAPPQVPGRRRHPHSAMAIGTDAGGSVRIPPAWNRRDVEDAALLLTVLQGADPRDRHTLGVHKVDPLPSLRRGANGLRLGRMPKEERAGIGAEVAAAI